MQINFTKAIASLFYDRFSWEPWAFSKQSGLFDRLRQKVFKWRIAKRTRLICAPFSYISEASHVGSSGGIEIGAKSAVGANVQIGGDIRLGANCTVNPNAIVRGKVAAGDGVRVASGAQLLGFNHTFRDIEKPIWRQPISRRGIEIGDDVWIGANAIVLDGVIVGSHSVVGAGSVVTKPVPTWGVVAGNPARFVKSRLYGSPVLDPNLEHQLTSFVSTVKAQIPSIISGHLSEHGFSDIKGCDPSVRAWTDAVELASMFQLDIPGLSRQTLVGTLQEFQDHETGLVFGPYGEGQVKKRGDCEASMKCGHSAYMTIAVGYALECISSDLLHPIYVARDIDCRSLCEQLESLPWREKAWPAGAWVDHYSSAQYFNLARGDCSNETVKCLFKWLRENIKADSGLWGEVDARGGLSQPVNGFYRLTRGSYAQFGLPVPLPERTIDSVLSQSHNVDVFFNKPTTACFVLDVIHPLWLCKKQTNYREGEVSAVAQWWLMRAMAMWKTGQGFSFETADDAFPSLKGTEMWLAIVWYCADILHLIDEREFFRPRGIHRPESVGAGYLTSP